MKIEAIHPDSDFSNSVVPAGTVLVFLGYSTGVATGCVVIRCKTSAGTFYNLTGCAG